MANVTFLTQDWLDRQRELAQEFPETPGATAAMQYTITGGPDGDVNFVCVVEDGKMLKNEMGEDPDVDFSLTVAYEDFEESCRGNLDATTAFMQGRLLVGGNSGKLMALMPVTQSPEYIAIQEELHTQTDYPDV